MRERFSATPLIMTLVGVAVLIGLGVWQLERRSWKTGLIERMNERMHGKSIPLERAKEFAQRNNGNIEYTRVVLTGSFLHDEERYLYAYIGGQQGWSVITPLVTQGGEVVLVNRGFVPEERKDPAMRKDGLIQGINEVKGVARLSEHTNWFTPVNNAAGNRWFWRDIPALISSLRAEEAVRAVPFVIEADAAPVPGGWPRGGITRVNVPNWHLEYAITWFALAGALTVVFITYSFGQRRQRRVARE